ncbi:hypothetical protein FIU94_02990 [Sulfitobacter sp. THAF37]|uniref:DUF4188 domain-containing protein n=1 Tax=Sulfitobacter sp. THAF37 TaxID=2587855 RepID=UPI001268D144|nr:DUF4188 domain-containing protein [Sulfitobacter sp. THAF37]QFT57779.1 hypothetical protein FIU94_02990 [Sulfitobacter sp. THAF37]
MAQINDKRLSARIEGDFVVFLIGIRINRPWKPQKWLPAVLAMPRMLRELQARPAAETGFLGYTTLGFGTLVQYWRSYDHLETYANAPDAAHFPAWKAFNKRARNSRADVGIWHETYLVRAGEYETVYSGMPDFGLGKAASLVPATGAMSGSRKRLEAGSGN